jgi:hypothetical protein
MGSESILSVFDEGVASAVRDELRSVGEVVLLHRLTRAAGRRDWFILEREGDLDAVRALGRPADSLAVFFGRQLPLRGVADDTMRLRVARLLDSEPLDTEIVVAEQRPGDPLLHEDEIFWRPSEPHPAWRDDQLEDVAAWFREHAGVTVVAGVHPPLLSEDPSDLLVAYWPNPDGSVERGIY